MLVFSVLLIGPSARLSTCRLARGKQVTTFSHSPYPKELKADRLAPAVHQHRTSADASSTVEAAAHSGGLHSIPHFDRTRARRRVDPNTQI